ncbi:helix-turn-helix transcriptional regulator [Fluviicola sp.]|uniref:helix-turn-helix domain-containing protein n=1 Tax=Fluviicola sp. TaxID=1917219 RepID=UPI0031D2A69C
MSVLSENLRYLRSLSRLSQREVARQLIIGRGRYSKYEEGTSEPPLAILTRIAKHYGISIDLLVLADLHRVPQEEIGKVEGLLGRFRVGK